MRLSMIVLVHIKRLIDERTIEAVNRLFRFRFRVNCEGVHLN